MKRLTDSDFPPDVVYETLAEVAAEGMAETYGCSATSHMLRLRADALDAVERDRMSALLTGEGPQAGADPPYPPLMRPADPSSGPPAPVWPTLG